MIGDRASRPPWWCPRVRPDAQTERSSTPAALQVSETHSTVFIGPNWPQHLVVAVRTGRESFALGQRALYLSEQFSSQQSGTEPRASRIQGGECRGLALPFGITAGQLRHADQRILADETAVRPLINCRAIDGGDPDRPRLRHNLPIELQRTGLVTAINREMSNGAGNARSRHFSATFSEAQLLGVAHRINR